MTSNRSKSSQGESTDLDCLKYVIDTVRAESDIDNLAEIAMSMFKTLGEIMLVCSASCCQAVRYAERIIIQQGDTLDRLRERVQEIPETLGEKTDAELRAFRVDPYIIEWEDGTEFEMTLEEGEPFVLANQLLRLIEQKNDQENEIEILEAEIECRLERATVEGWIP